MAGHSRWKNIKHRKAAADAKRGKAWSKCVKAVMVAAKNGGPDAESNLSLRYAIDEARYANVPRDTIERAIKKGSGELIGQSFENVRYEGYGPGGTAIIVDALTDNRTRTAGDIRLIFNDNGGNLGASGCVMYQFSTLGEIVISGRQSGVSGGGNPAAQKATITPVNPDEILEMALELGAEDVVAPEVTEPGGSESDGGMGGWRVMTPPEKFHFVKEGLEKAGFVIAEATIALIPGTTVTVSGDAARRLLEMIEALEDNDDVQKVYSNFEISESELAAMAE